MIFQHGKKISADDETVRQETFQRWRDASMRSQLQENPAGEEVKEVKVDAMRAVEWPDPKVERPTVTLTQQVEMEDMSTQPTRVSSFEHLQKRPAPQPAPAQAPVQSPLSAAPAPQPAPQPIQKTSKLAQFVTSGLSAAGLVSTAPRQTESKPADQARMEIQETVRPIIAERRVQTVEVPLTPDEEVKRRYGSNVRSALGPGTIIEGTFSFDSPVCIEGTLLGEVRSDSVLIVGSQASVQAKVRVGSLVVLGSVKGNVEADELVDIKNGGSLEGDVKSERFAIQDGGWFQGKCLPTAPNKLLRAKQENAVKNSASGMPAEISVTGSSDKWRIA